MIPARSGGLSTAAPGISNRGGNGVGGERMLGLGTTCTSYMVHVGIKGAKVHLHYALRETL